MGEKKLGSVRHAGKFQHSCASNRAILGAHWPLLLYRHVHVHLNIHEHTATQNKDSIVVTLEAFRDDETSPY